MNNIQLKEANQEAAKAKFRGKKRLVSKRRPQYPDSPERELQRVYNAYMKVLQQELKKQLPAMMREYRSTRNDDVHYDGWLDLYRSVRRMFRDIHKNLEQRFADFDLRGKVRQTGGKAQKAGLREWKATVKKTLGIDLFDDYYKGSFYGNAVDQWVDDNVSYISSLPNESLDRMEEIILDGFKKGRTIKDIQREIQNEFNVTKSHAKMLARDQMGTLNARITEAQHRDAGVTHYRWSTSHDSRVRDCHAALDGKIFSWDDPPEMWYDTKSRGRVHTGRRCHPGEDYLCRCVPIPVFDFNSMNIPMGGR